jgi:aspartyl-tRNA(Asn)/glutamyl-tRNA(Gln) amidotransferase subunit B
VAEYEAVIGLEIHVQLKTKTKMFCRCANEWGAEPNTRTCPVCLAHPGTLPVPNGQAIEWAVKLGLALGCAIAPRALFHRKHYWYPDLPKGYQISQYDVPIASGGRFVVLSPDGDHEIGIVRAHLEEDAAKTVHVGGEGGRIRGAGASLVDFNRGGTPLVEIVTEPDLRTPDEARRFLQLLRQTVVELGISDAEMEKGSLRCDANVSVREVGEEGYRTKTELKNMNSFKFVADGIAAEVERQIAAYEAGEPVTQETLHYDPSSGRLTPLRSKEYADDYRYFPEPDLVPVEPSGEMVERIGAELEELPAARVRRFEADYGLSFYDADVLNGSVALAALFEGVVVAGAEPKAAANVLTNQFTAAGVDPAAVDPAELAKLIESRDTIPRATLAEALAASGDDGFTAERYLADASVSDVSELDPVIDRILAANEGQVAAYRAGKEGLLGFFVGQVMKETEGKANPKVVNERLRERLGA